MRIRSSLLALVLLISFCLTGCQEQQRMSVKDYTAKYASTIDFEKGMDDKTFGNAAYRVFLSGEHHSQAKSYQTKKMLIQYLHEKQGVDYLLYEAGMAHGVLLDDYIQTKNEENLTFWMNELKGTLAYTQEEYEFCHWLYDYNQQQPENHKLHIIGLDVEHQQATSARGLSLLMDDSVTPAKEIQSLIERIKESDGTAVEEFPQALEDYPEQMKEVFGENFPWVEQYAKNVTATYQFFDWIKAAKPNPHQIRDNAMMDNFRFVLEQLPKEAKFFGQFGLDHVIQSGGAGYNTFATQLQEDDSPVKGELCSIDLVYVYQSDRSRIGYQCEVYHNEPITLFRDYYGKDTFVSLDEKGSPFFRYEGEESKDREDFDDKFAIGTTDYFQKILLLTDSEECQPYQE